MTDLKSWTGVGGSEKIPQNKNIRIKKLLVWTLNHLNPNLLSDVDSNEVWEGGAEGGEKWKIPQNEMVWYQKL